MKERKIKKLKKIWEDFEEWIERVVGHLIEAFAVS